MNKIVKIVFAVLLYILITPLSITGAEVGSIKIYDQEFEIYFGEKGESLYAIAQKMNWDYDTLVQTNILIDSKINNNQMIFYPIIRQETCKTDSLIKEIIFYNPKITDSLHEIAIKHNSSVERIFELNPILSSENFEKVEVIKIEVNSNIDNIICDTIDVREVYAFKSYKIEKNDSWVSIAEANNISTEELQASNPATTNLKKGKLIHIPIFKLVSKQKRFYKEDARELTDCGLDEIYNSVHNTYDSVDSIPAIDVAIITNIADNKIRDAEFIKGFLMGIDYLKDSIHKINLTVYDLSLDDVTIESIIETDTLKDMEFIISTHDKDFPVELANFGLEHNIEIINLFDLKNESYKTNSQFVQIYPPSSYFNQMIASYLVDNFSDYTFIFIGDIDTEDSDAIETIIKSEFDNNAIQYIHKSSVDHISSISYDINKKYLFIPNIVKKGEIDKFINNLITLQSDHASLDISVVGKPNWIALPQGIKKYLHQINTYIPSRFFFDKTQVKCHNFESDFIKHYGYAPVQTNPIFAVVGYDVARYFIESYYYNYNDLNNIMSNYDALQTDFNLLRIDNWSGLYNHIAYLIHFTPYNMVEKLKICN